MFSGVDSQKIKPIRFNDNADQYLLSNYKNYFLSNRLDEDNKLMLVKVGNPNTITWKLMPSRNLEDDDDMQEDEVRDGEHFHSEANDLDDMEAIFDSELKPKKGDEEGQRAKTMTCQKYNEDEEDLLHDLALNTSNN